MSVTVVDIAREVGVSRTTVSNVFSGKDKCSAIFLTSLLMMKPVGTWPRST